MEKTSERSVLGRHQSCSEERIEALYIPSSEIPQLQAIKNRRFSRNRDCSIDWAFRFCSLSQNDLCRANYPHSSRRLWRIYWGALQSNGRSVVRHIGWGHRKFRKVRWDLAVIDEYFDEPDKKLCSDKYVCRTCASEKGESNMTRSRELGVLTLQREWRCMHKIEFRAANEEKLRVKMHEVRYNLVQCLPKGVSSEKMEGLKEIQSTLKDVEKQWRMFFDEELVTHWNLNSAAALTICEYFLLCAWCRCRDDMTSSPELQVEICHQAKWGTAQGIRVYTLRICFFFDLVWRWWPVHVEIRCRAEW